MKDPTVQTLDTNKLLVKTLGKKGLKCGIL